MKEQEAPEGNLPERKQLRHGKKRRRRRLPKGDFPPFFALAWDLSVGLAWRVLTRRTLSPSAMRRWFGLRDTFRRHRMPMDLFRNIEYTFTLANLPPLEGRRVLDVGSGDTPFVAHLLSSNPGVKVTLNEIDPEAIAAQRKYLQADEVDGARYEIVEENLAVTSLEGPAKRFDFVTVVSTIEHFPGNGDIEFLRGIWKHLDMGATLIITVPAHDAFSEQLSTHYHGIFERRYDTKAIYTRLQQNGYRVRHLRYMRHGSTLTAKRLKRRYGNLNEFFASWYLLSEREKYSYEFVAMMSLLLLDLSPVPTRDMIGALMVLEKEPRRVLDPLDSIPLQAPFRVGDLYEPRSDHRGRVYIPLLEGEMHRRDFVQIPLLVFNYTNEPYFTAPNTLGPWHIGVTLQDLERNEEIWDYCHIPLIHRIEPGEGMHINVEVPITQDRRHVRLIVDLVKDGFFWQRMVGGKAGWVELRILD